MKWLLIGAAINLRQKGTRHSRMLLRTLSRRSAALWEAATGGPRPIPSAPDIYAAVTSECGRCSDACRNEQREWQSWLETTFGRGRPVTLARTNLAPRDHALLAADRQERGGAVHAAPIPLAVLDLQGGHGAYWEEIGPKGRNMVRKAEKAGYRFGQFDWNQHLDDIFEINRSMPERGGKPMAEAYRQRPSAISSSAFCDQRLRRFFGAFQDDRLVAYLTLVVSGHFAVVNTILGHGDHLRFGIMNGLVDHMVKELESEGGVRYVNYLSLRGGRESLNAFKRRLGFAERRAIYLAHPRISG